MLFRSLGKTGIEISALSFGAGPISTLMVGQDEDRQCRVVQTAVERGINWFDTAATYGGGESESNLGRVLASLPSGASVHVATKVRLLEKDLGDVRSAIRRSFEASLQRLRLPRVTLLQLHNSLTPRRNIEPTSITPQDVLRTGGIADVFRELQAEGLVGHIGLTGIGSPASLCEVIDSGQFETAQVPYHLLNPSAGCNVELNFSEVNYGNIIARCARQGMGVLAIRVLAGGALAGNAPSPHTLKTPFFPLELFDRDSAYAARLRELLGPERDLPQEAVRFVLAHPSIHSALIGFADVDQIDHAVMALNSKAPPLNWQEIREIGSQADFFEKPLVNGS